MSLYGKSLLTSISCFWSSHLRWWDLNKFSSSLLRSSNVFPNSAANCRSEKRKEKGFKIKWDGFVLFTISANVGFHLISFDSISLSHGVMRKQTIEVAEIPQLLSSFVVKHDSFISRPVITGKRIDGEQIAIKLLSSRRKKVCEKCRLCLGRLHDRTIFAISQVSFRSLREKDSPSIIKIWAWELEKSPFGIIEFQNFKLIEKALSWNLNVIYLWYVFLRRFHRPTAKQCIATFKTEIKVLAKCVWTFCEWERGFSIEENRK